MTTNGWPIKRLSVASLYLDARNPRLARETFLRIPCKIMQHFFEHNKAYKEEL
jgi:hypothetical protein